MVVFDDIKEEKNTSLSVTDHSLMLLSDVMNATSIITEFDRFVYPPSPQITVTDHGLPPKSTTVRVIVQVLDENDNRPLFLEKIYKIKLPERERPEKERATRREPVYRVIASDRDDGPNAEISYSIEEGDENGKFFIEPKTGLVSSKKFSSAGEYDILTVSGVTPDTASFANSTLT